MAIELERQSTVDQAAAALRREILAGRLKPGTPLREVEIADRLGISRNTLRETLRLLAHQGLVVHSPHRGATVAAISARDVADIFEVRRVLEIEGLWAGGDRSLATIESAVERLEITAGEGDWLAYGDHEAAFHEALVARIGSPRLSRAFAGALRELQVALAGVDLAQPADGTLPPYVREHREIASFLRTGEIESAEALLAAHLDDSKRLVLRHLRESSGNGL
jgi:DNA-binding GntR family transcriptional regulator